MLILTRRTGEDTVIGSPNAEGEHTLFDVYGNPVEITITILGVKGNQVRFGTTAPRQVTVHRSEIADRIRRERKGPVDGNVAPDVVGAAA